MDRASGSGVFARDPDAQLDMIELELTDEVQNWVAKRGASAWRLEGSLREFENFTPVNFWFEYPIHRVDDKGILGAMPAQGTSEAGKMKNGGFSMRTSLLLPCASPWRPKSSSLPASTNPL